MIKRLKQRLLSRLRAELQVPPAYIGNHGCIRTAASFVTWNQVPGDYLEFGVWQGRSFVEAYHRITEERRAHHSIGFDSPDYVEWQKAPPRFFAFDSFEGIPAGEAARMVDYGEGAYACSEDDFISNLVAANVDVDRVTTVPGYYDDTCTPEARTRLGLTQAAVVFIDCDLYESTVPVLDFITPIVQQGTIIIFEDWFRFRGSPDMGEQRACNEWLARNPQLELIEYWKEGPQAVSFLVNLRS